MKEASSEAKSEFNVLSRRMVEKQQKSLRRAQRSGSESKLRRAMRSAKDVQEVTRSKTLSEALNILSRRRQSSEGSKRSSSTSRRSSEGSKRSSSTFRRSSEALERSRRVSEDLRRSSRLIAQSKELRKQWASMRKSLSRRSSRRLSR